MTHQAVILDAVVLVTKKPVGFHFPFALKQEKESRKQLFSWGIKQSIAMAKATTCTAFITSPSLLSGCSLE